ncbi:AraC family transcriptional regulator [Corynebacterium suranareeae]|uniref:AraC family transcriptional regulator n=1 Tax=Corynebacterium suranareeae TaxID=2506452 RepID=A0A160PMD2_9CORY|nr:AraC family transcriptional regulator [Corynebacterium suranareeae]BAU94899.1 AraC family transcriptional regulator [Corynebacterium suranareeae]
MTMTMTSKTVQAPAFPITEPIVVTDRLHPESHILFWQYRGTSTISLNDDPKVLRADEALWVPAGFRHSLYVNSNSLLLRIFFPKSHVNINAELTSSHILHVNAELSDLLMSMVQSDSSLIHDRGALDQYVVDRIVEHMNSPMWPQSAASRQIAEFLNENPGDLRTLEQLARFVHTSPRTIEREFCNETGLTFQEWRMHCRISEAKRLIKLGLPVDSVAFRVGYSTASSFGRAFKRQTGVTPSSYAEQF